MKNLFLYVAAVFVIFSAGYGNPGSKSQSAHQQAGGKVMSPYMIEIASDTKAREVKVTVGGKQFTSYCYWENLKKPVFYPLVTDDGRTVNRGYPVKMVPGERVDHPHQISYWFNYGDVNGDDYWGHSDSSRAGGAFGTIVHRSVNAIVSGEKKGYIDVTMDWIGSKGTKVLEEKDRVFFRAGPGLRIIDRVINLTAQKEKVVFGDTKEGMLGLRVTRTLEEPSTEPLRFVDARGEITEVPSLDNTGVGGEYLSSEGRVGEKEVWGTRSKWCILRGKVQEKPVTIAIFDHPDNVGYPTYWHARGYGLFAANPLGWKTFTNGKEVLNFTLQPGESTTFRYRMLIASRRLEKEEAEQLYQGWLKEISK